MSGFNNPLVGGGGALVYPNIHSPGFQHGVQGWTINKDGSAEFNNLTIRGTFDGTDYEINANGVFFYSGVPAFGNLISSIARIAGTDSLGNAYVAGFASYSISGGVSFAVSLFVNGFLPGILFYRAPAGPAGPWFLGNTIETDTTSGNLTLNTVDSVQVRDFLGSGLALLVQGLAAVPSAPLTRIDGFAAGDNCLGLQVAADAFTRLRIDTNGLMRWGSGAAAQDARLYRSGVGQLAADTILANIGSAAETWHSLGTLTGAAVNIARYRLMPDGLVHIEIDVTFGVATAASTLTFSNTLPVAYRPLSTDVDVRRPTSMTNGAGVIARIFIGQAGGAAPGQVQLANLGAGNYIGTYSAEANYAVI